MFAEIGLRRKLLGLSLEVVNDDSELLSEVLKEAEKAGYPRELVESVWQVLIKEADYED